LPSSNNSLETKSETSEVASNDAQNTKAEKPQIAIILTNLGMNQKITDLALSLPEEVSLGFVPYSSSAKLFIDKAKELHHEIFIYLPFESKNPMDFPGQMPILLSLSDEENLNRLSNLLKPFEGCDGVYANHKEIFTSNITKSYPIIEELKKRNLMLFLGNIENTKSFTGERGIVPISTDIILDQDPHIASIKNNLDKLVELARKKNYAVAYAEGYPVTIYTLKAWLPSLEKKGISLVPVSQIKRKTINKDEVTNAK
jgi:polysaccharide deacetylase 2 family uncharacterized protein YibQ